MTDLIGVNYSAAIVQQLEQRLNEKGIVLHSQEDTTEGTHLTAEGLGNKKRHSIIIANLPDKPSDEDAAALVSQHLASIEAGLRSAPMPEEAE